MKINENKFCNIKSNTYINHMRIMNTLKNTINLLRESLSDASHYAEQVELILKERKQKKTSRQYKEEKERKRPQKETSS